jgi:glycerophosphoryl diester phosphodiesterase
MSSKTSVPLIIGHRGASALAPENTLAAFRRAIEAGAEGLEFDVRLARDGVPVVIHDETLTRTGRMSAFVSEMTSRQLAGVDVGSWFNAAAGAGITSEFCGETVPTLARTLEFLTDYRGRLFIELKCGPEDVEPLTDAVCSVLAVSPLLPQVIVKSFKLAVIPRVKMRIPAARTAALFAPKMMNILRKEKYLVDIAEEFGADELSLHRSLATTKLMESSGKRGLPVNIWTADNPRWVKKGIRLGLNSIITNDPGRLLQRRAELLSDPRRAETQV